MESPAVTLSIAPHPDALPPLPETPPETPPEMPPPETPPPKRPRPETPPPKPPRLEPPCVERQCAATQTVLPPEGAITELATALLAAFALGVTTTGLLMLLSSRRVSYD